MSEADREAMRAKSAAAAEATTRIPNCCTAICLLLRQSLE